MPARASGSSGLPDHLITSYYRRELILAWSPQRDVPRSGCALGRGPLAARPSAGRGWPTNGAHGPQRGPPDGYTPWGAARELVAARSARPLVLACVRPLASPLLLLCPFIFSTAFAISVVVAAAALRLRRRSLSLSEAAREANAVQNDESAEPSHRAPQAMQRRLWAEQSSPTVLNSR